MSLRNTVFLLVVASALATGTLFLASMLFADFHSWMRSLPERRANKLVLPGLLLLTVLSLILGAYLRRRANPSGYEL